MAAGSTWVTMLPGGVEMRCAGRDEGDFSLAVAPGADAARRKLAEVPWTWLRQVHGAGVVTVHQPGAASGAEADAAVTACPGVALAVVTADCAPVGLASPEGVAGIVHAGWRGLVRGVVGAALGAMRSLGATRVQAALGPCIRAHAYTFSEADLALVSDRFGSSVRAEDEAGRPALDLAASVEAALAEEGVPMVADAGTCTHCSASHWSWRARGDIARQASLVLSPAAQ